MKLRNKKTGEVIDAGCRTALNGDFWITRNGGGKPIYMNFYGSLAELNEEWEDHKPKEPLIEDEKIRKAVRAWAEANDIDRVWHEYSSCWLRGNGLTIELENEVTELEQGNYAIDELCGEEEALEGKK